MKTKTIFKDFDVQNIEINANEKEVFSFLAKPETLPLWAKVFVEASHTSAIIATPDGNLSIEFEILVSEKSGTIDWIMTMPDGSTNKASSRVTKNGKSSVYSFVLLAPPVPLEQIEEAFSEQKLILAKELVNLKVLLEEK